MAELGPISQEEFERLILKGVSLINFNAYWCGACRAQAPIVDELAKVHDGKATVIKVNVDRNQLIAMHLGIQSIPTTILFKEGREMDRFIGLQETEVLDSALRAALL